MPDRYFNNGWFGRHPSVYEVASLFIAPLRRYAARIAGRSPGRIIDIATGTGANAVQLAKLGHSVIGVDLDREMLAKAQKKRRAHLVLDFMHGDGTALPFEDDSFDAATISFAMHDVPPEIGVGILREARRVVRPKGRIHIIDYNDLGSSFGARLLYRVARFYESPNYFGFVRGGVVRYLEAAGLTVDRKRHFLGAVQFLSAV